jgi:hypothetical protein
LAPSIAKYSVDNTDPSTTFKKTIVDLEQIAQAEKEEKFQKQM